jgi:hypothetical protein
MGVILYSDFKSSNGLDYTIEIIDNEFNGASTEFKTDSRGFTLQYSGETDDIVSPVISSACTVGMYIESISLESLFIDNIKRYQEDRYFIRIYNSEASRVVDVTENAVNEFNARVISDGGTVEQEQCLKEDITALGNATVTIPGFTDALYWTGKITQDLVSIEDQYYPYLYEITAVDGIGLLANQEYTTTGNKTIFEVFKESVDLLSIDSLYRGTDFYLNTCFNTWDINQIYNADNDASKLIRFNTFVYRETNDDGSFTEPNALDVLKQICTLFGARIYQRSGAYVLEQYKERENISYRYFNYDTQGDEVTVEDKEDDTAINQTSAQGARLNGGSYNFLPALKKVEVSYNQIRLNNLLANRLVFTGASSAVNLGTLVNDNNGQINLTGNLFYSFLYNGTGATQSLLWFRPVFRIQLKQEDILNPGTFYYLKRDFIPGGGNAVYGATSWTTVASYYYLDAGIAKNSNQGLNLASSFNIVTPPLQVDGLASLDIEFYNVYDIVGNLTSVPVNYTDTATINEVTAMFINNGTPGTTLQIFTSTNGSANIKSNLTLDLGELILGDSSGMDGSLYVYNGSSWVPSTSWRRGNSGSYINLYKLLTKEVLSLYNKPVQRYSVTIIAPYTYGTRFLWSSDYYLPTGVSYNAGTDEYSGEWFVIDSDDTQITIGTPVDSNPVDASFKGSFDGQGGTTNVVLATDGNIAGMALDTTTSSIGPFSETGTGGKITGTVNVTGATTLDTTLGVTGNVTTSGSVSAVDLEASGDVLADGAVQADSVVSATSVSGNTLSATTSVSGGSLSVTNNASVGGSISGNSISSTTSVSAATLSTTGNADVGGTLGVTGLSTLATTSVGAFTSTNSVSVTINSITATAGASETLDSSKHFNFLSYSGGNGSYTITLPPAEDGVILRFKTNDTI